jgi:hypothetical protein
MRNTTHDKLTTKHDLIAYHRIYWVGSAPLFFQQCALIVIYITYVMIRKTWSSYDTWASPEARLGTLGVCISTRAIEFSFESHIQDQCSYSIKKQTIIINMKLRIKLLLLLPLGHNSFILMLTRLLTVVQVGDWKNYALEAIIKGVLFLISCSLL